MVETHTHTERERGRGRERERERERERDRQREIGPSWPSETKQHAIKRRVSIHTETLNTSSKS